MLNDDTINLGNVVMDALEKLKKTFPDIHNIVAEHGYLTYILLYEKKPYAMLDTTRQIPDTFNEYKRLCTESIMEAKEMGLFNLKVKHYN